MKDDNLYELDSIPVKGYTRAGYVILLDGKFFLDAGSIDLAQAYMAGLRAQANRPARTLGVRRRELLSSLRIRPFMRRGNDRLP